MQGLSLRKMHSTKFILTCGSSRLSYMKIKFNPHDYIIINRLSRVYPMITWINKILYTFKTPISNTLRNFNISYIFFQIRLIPTHRESHPYIHYFPPRTFMFLLYNLILIIKVLFSKYQLHNQIQ